MVGRARLRTEGTLIGPPFTITMSDSLSPDQRERYARHLVLPDVGSEGQEKLLSSSILVVGAGGLGSPALMYLAAAGVGRIGIIDNDKVSSSNLQRQIIHDSSSIGSPKVNSASNWISKLNPDIFVEEIEEKLTLENSMKIRWIVYAFITGLFIYTLCSCKTHVGCDAYGSTDVVVETDRV